MRSATDDDDSKSDDDTVFESTTDLRQSFVAALQKKREKGNPKQYVVCVQKSPFFPSLFCCVCFSLSPLLSLLERRRSNTCTSFIRFRVEEGEREEEDVFLCL